MDLYSQLDQVITGIDCIPLSSPYGDGYSFGQPLGVKSVVILRLWLDDGTYGLGETYSGIYLPEVISPIIEAIKYAIIGKSISDDTIVSSIFQIPFVGHSGIIKSIAGAIDISIWDVRGKILQKPTHQLLAKDYRNSLQVYASSGSAIMSETQIKKDVQQIMNLGFKSYKMRIGYQDWGIDLERVRAAREELDTMNLMLDAIMGTLRPPWSLETARMKITQLYKYNIYWLEEPLYPDDIHSLSILRRESSIPLAAGEAYSSKSQFDYILDVKAVDYLQVDATHSGGISECLNILEESKKRNIKQTLHVWGSSVAIASNAHIAAANKDVLFLEIPMVNLDISDDMWIEKPKVKDGVMQVPLIPGLGVQINDELIDKYKFVPGSGYRLP